MILTFDARIVGTEIHCEIGSDTAVLAPVFCCSNYVPSRVVSGGTLVRTVAGYTEVALPNILAGGTVRFVMAYQEAGFAPLEVIRSATINGARTLMDPKHVEPDFGLVRVGMAADLVIAPENPLANFKTLYGTGFIRLDPATNRSQRVGGIRWTIKHGIVYDAPALLADVRAMVTSAKAAGH